jgi:hypothetical protein
MVTSMPYGFCGAGDRFCPGIVCAHPRHNIRRHADVALLRMIQASDDVGNRFPGQATSGPGQALSQPRLRRTSGKTEATSLGYAIADRGRLLSGREVVHLRQPLASLAAPVDSLRMTLAPLAGLPAVAASAASVWRRLAERVGFENSHSPLHQQLTAISIRSIRSKRTKAAGEVQKRSSRIAAHGWPRIF